MKTTSVVVGLDCLSVRRLAITAERHLAADFNPCQIFFVLACYDVEVCAKLARHALLSTLKAVH